MQLYKKIKIWMSTKQIYGITYSYQMKSPVASNQAYRFQLLFNTAHLVLVTAHSNGGIEHVYALRITLKVQTDAGWISNSLCFQSLQSSLLNQKLFSSAMTLNLMKIFCMMLKKQQESITRCTLQFEFLQMLHNTAINIIF